MSWNIFNRFFKNKNERLNSLDSVPLAVKTSNATMKQDIMFSNLINSLYTRSTSFFSRKKDFVIFCSLIICGITIAFFAINNESKNVQLNMLRHELEMNEKLEIKLSYSELEKIHNDQSLALTKTHNKELSDLKQKQLNESCELKELQSNECKELKRKFDDLTNTS